MQNETNNPVPEVETQGQQSASSPLINSHSEALNTTSLNQTVNQPFASSAGAANVVDNPETTSADTSTQQTGLTPDSMADQAMAMGQQSPTTNLPQDATVQSVDPTNKPAGYDNVNEYTSGYQTGQLPQQYVRPHSDQMTNMVSTNRRSNRKLLFILGAVLLVILFGAIGYFALFKKDETQPISNNSSSLSEDTNNSGTIDDSSNSFPSKERFRNGYNFYYEEDGYITVDSWGVRFKVDPSLKDVEAVIADDNNKSLFIYAKPKDSSVDYVEDYYMKDKKLRMLEVVMRNDLPTEKNKITDENVQGKQIGDNYYYTYNSFSSLVGVRLTRGLYFNDHCLTKEVMKEQDDECGKLLDLELSISSAVDKMLKTIELI